MQSILDEFINQFGSAETRYCYRNDIRSFQQYMGVNDLRGVTLQQLKTYQKDTKTAPGARRRIACVKSLFKFMFNNGYIENNVCRVLKVPKKTPIKVKREMNREGVQELLHAASTNKEIILVTLLYYLGVRKDEVRLLKKCDIKLQGGSLHFTVTGKGNKTRTVPLSKTKSTYIKPLLDAIPNGYVFKGRFGGPMSKSGLHKMMKRVCNRVGFPQVSCHWLRHCHCSHLLAAGAPLAACRDRLGHVSITTTNTYIFSDSTEIAQYLD